MNKSKYKQHVDKARQIKKERSEISGKIEELIKALKEYNKHLDELGITKTNAPEKDWERIKDRKVKNAIENLEDNLFTRNGDYYGSKAERIRVEGENYLADITLLFEDKRETYYDIPYRKSVIDEAIRQT